MVLYFIYRVLQKIIIKKKKKPIAFPTQPGLLFTLCSNMPLALFTLQPWEQHMHLPWKSGWKQIQLGLGKGGWGVATEAQSACWAWEPQAKGAAEL